MTRTSPNSRVETPVVPTCVHASWPALQTDWTHVLELQGARSPPGTSSVAGTQVAGTSLPSRAGTQPQTALRASFHFCSFALFALLGIPLSRSLHSCCSGFLTQHYSYTEQNRLNPPAA